MFVLQAGWIIAVFITAVFVAGAAAGPRHISSPLLRLAAGVVYALAGQFVLAFGGFAAGFSNSATAIGIGSLTVLVLALRRRAATSLLADPDVREFGAAWLLFALWSVGLLALVVTYSGGGWAVDWVEHWQRTEFFLHRQPLDTRFGALYSLTARPPLANLLIALWLEAARGGFAGYQILMTLFGTLILLPLWVLAQRWGGMRAGWWLLVVLMVNPLVAQNLTFTWTKLPTAFFVLTTLVLGIAATEQPENAPLLRRACALSLGLGVVTHYSAGPWVVAFAVGVGAAAGANLCTLRFWRSVIAPATNFLLPIALWLGWAAAHFGWQGTTESNTTTSTWQTETAAQRVSVPVRNFFDTLVPFPLRGEPADGLIVQASRLGRVRDIAFNVYQINLPCSLGLAGLFVALWACTRSKNDRAAAKFPMLATPLPIRRFFLVALPLVTIVNAVVAPRDEWGLAHICLQPLTLMGLGYVAANLTSASRRLRATWAALVMIDVALGVILHFGLESWAWARFVSPSQNGISYVRQLSQAAWSNANDKAAFQFEFVSDRLQAPSLVVVVLLALFLGYSLHRASSHSVGRHNNQA